MAHGIIPLERIGGFQQLSLHSAKQKANESEYAENQGVPTRKKQKVAPKNTKVELSDQ